MKILYVEDNPLNMRLVQKILKSVGHDMIPAPDGLTGIAIAAREEPDLILMDINLPDIDGLDVTSRLKASPDLSWIPVVAVTANAMHGDRERYIAAGCDGYIAKPVTKVELINTIKYFTETQSKPAVVAS